MPRPDPSFKVWIKRMKARKEAYERKNKKKEELEDE